MKLHEAIEQILKLKEMPLTFDEIAKEINEYDLYLREDLKNLTGSQIRLRITKYSKLFININGYVILTSNKKWRNLLSAYWDLSNNLKGYYNISDLEFIVASLFYYKRLNDLNNKTNFIDTNKFIYSFNNSYINYDNINNLDNLGPKIFEDLARLLQENTFGKIEKLLKPLQDFNTIDFTDEEYGNAFEYVLQINNSENLKTGLVRTPRPIIELMSKIIDPKKGKLYDPVCGTGGFLTQAYRMSKELKIFGSEINYRIAQIAYMNQVMNGDFNATIIAEDCFDQLTEDIKYDYIIGDLPMDSINSNYFNELSIIWNLNFPKKAKSFGAFILFSLSKLSDKGKAIFTVSESFLFKSGIDEQIRNTLLQNDFIETVISLPNGALKPYTNGKAAILVLNKSKSLYQRDKIKFINLPKQTNYTGIDVNQILEFYKDELSNNPFVQNVSINDVIELGTLNPSNYTNDLLEVRKLLISGNAKYISDLMNSISGIAPYSKDDISKEYGIPFIKIENLERDILDMYLSKKSIKDYILSSNPKYDKYVINKECLLLAKIGDNIKPTYFKPENGFSEIILHSNVIAIFPKSNSEVSLEFLYYQFYSDFVINQIEQKLTKSIMPFITIGAIKELIIPVLDYKNQKDFIEFQKANSIAAEQSRVDDRFKKIGYIEDAQERELNVVRTITHQLKHHLTGIFTIMGKVNAITTKHNLSDLKEYDKDDYRLIVLPGFEQPENITLGETVKKAIKKAETINNILIDVEKAINFSLEYSNTNIFDLIEEIKNEYRDKEYSIEVIGDNTIVEVSKTHLEDLIHTLIKNAEEHSFLNAKKHKISFSIKNNLHLGIVTIEYKNNGLPLTISEKEFKSILTKSISSNGNGIGGYYINKIIEAHKGSMKIIENLTTGVHFIIELPINHFENE